MRASFHESNQESAASGRRPGKYVPPVSEKHPTMAKHPHNDVGSKINSKFAGPLAQSR